MAVRSIAAITAAALVAGPGCGGAMKPQELARSVQTLGSSAAEGKLLARGVADDRTKATFVRAHARDLGEVVDHEAEKLADAEAGGVVAVRKAEAVALADRIADALGLLQDAPGAESEARIAGQRLGRAADRAARLADAL